MCSEKKQQGNSGGQALLREQLRLSEKRGRALLKAKKTNRNFKFGDDHPGSGNAHSKEEQGVRENRNHKLAAGRKLWCKTKGHELGK